MTHPSINDLITTIDRICAYGLQNRSDHPFKIPELEEDLVKIYGFYFQIKDPEDDAKQYPDHNGPSYAELAKMVGANFKGFGYYRTITNILDFEDKDNETGDAIDDLVDIIQDLLAVKWRIEHNSEDDGLRHFKSMFRIHTGQHLIHLLNYLKAKEGQSE